MPETAKTASSVKKSKTANTAAKKSAEKTVKYSDKSAGQPELIPIFETIKALMKPYAKGTIVEQGGEGGMYGLISKKAVEIEGRKNDEVYFAGLLIQKGYVGFYFMPVYAETELKKVFKPELLKCLKGKSCFHIKRNDSAVMEQIGDALKAGYELYKEKGWV